MVHCSIGSFLYVISYTKFLVVLFIYFVVLDLIQNWNNNFEWFNSTNKSMTFFFIFIWVVIFFYIRARIALTLCWWVRVISSSTAFNELCEIAHTHTSWENLCLIEQQKKKEESERWWKSFHSSFVFFV